MDSFSYANNWMQKYVEKQLFDEKKCRQSPKYIEEAKIKIGNTMQLVEKAIVFATNNLIGLTKEKEKNTPEVKNAKIKTWIKQFCKNLQDNQFPINNALFGTLLDSNVTDFTNFQENIITQFYAEQTKLKSHFKSIHSSTVKWERGSPINQIMEKLWGYTAQCPFCREPCMWMHNHEGKSHKCLQHRPQGVGGQFWLGTKELVMENCNLMVNTTNQKFGCTRWTWEEVSNEAQKVDLAFLLDITASMHGIIKIVKGEVDKVIDKVKNEYPRAHLRVAFVGYRDHWNYERIVKMDFTESLISFSSFMSKIKASGGGFDTTEDVFGGLEEAGNLSWTAPNRLLMHFADAPCHGSRFHEGLWDRYKKDNYKDIKGLKIKDLIKKLKELDIKYYFGKINESTNKMITEFKKVSGDNNFPHEIDASCAATALNVVAESITLSIHQSILEWRERQNVIIISKNDKNKSNKMKCKTFWHYYKDYKSCLTNWDIAPDSIADTFQYWQWFMYNYSKELQELHGGELRDMPESWGTIDVEKAKQSLRNHFT
ncbi:unnamed protein product [Meganyctiphanes norvegica]|uniref:VWFA domain-containing protein n=1 Tax=Meganyctiphanes norvegica TaxID=48144 RepID=A0AAV2RHC2_MEGNR